MSVHFREGPDGLACRLLYDTQLFDVETVEGLAGHYRTLLGAIADDPEQRLSKLPLLTERERDQILVGWNATAVSYPTDRGIHHLIEDQVERTPNAPAAVFEGEQLSYHELNQRANRIAAALMAQGIGRGSYVPILMDRSL